MGVTGKFVVAIFVIAVISIALLIRHQEAGFKAFYERNFEKARPLLTLTAEIVGPLAAFYLGRVYFWEAGPNYNPESAKIWNLRIARSGFADAAVMYLTVAIKHGGSD